MNEIARILDSSVVIRHFREGGAATLRLESFGALYLPCVALGELRSGAERSARPDRNHALIDSFAAGVAVLTVDDETARRYGEISARLAAEGALIPQNDMWIAACAIQWGLTLATTDDHFCRVRGLNFEKW